MKEYSFLQEFFTTALAGTAAVMGGVSLVKNTMQNRVDSSIIKEMTMKLFQCKDRQQAIQTLNNYCNNLLQFKSNGKNQKALQITQYKLKLNYYTPILKIINNQKDINWHHNMMSYLKKTNTSTSRTNLKNTALGTLGTGLAATSAINPALLAGAAVPLKIYSLSMLATKQLKFFRGRFYINKMTKELNACQNRQEALQIVEKYSYQITTDINDKIQKTKKGVPYNVEKQIRAQFYNPLKNIIIKNSDISWKVAMMDYLKSNTLESTLQNVCDSVLYFLLPKIIRGGNAQVKEPIK